MARHDRHDLRPQRRDRGREPRPGPFARRIQRHPLEPLAALRRLAGERHRVGRDVPRVRPPRAPRRARRALRRRLVQLDPHDLDVRVHGEQPDQPDAAVEVEQPAALRPLERRPGPRVEQLRGGRIDLQEARRPQLDLRAADRLEDRLGPAEKLLQGRRAAPRHEPHHAGEIRPRRQQRAGRRGRVRPRRRRPVHDEQPPTRGERATNLELRRPRPRAERGEPLEELPREGGRPFRREQAVVHRREAALLPARMEPDLRPFAARGHGEADPPAVTQRTRRRRDLRDAAGHPADAPQRLGEGAPLHRQRRRFVEDHQRAAAALVLRRAGRHAARVRGPLDGEQFPFGPAAPQPDDPRPDEVAGDGAGHEDDEAAVPRDAGAFRREVGDVGREPLAGARPRRLGIDAFSLV